MSGRWKYATVSVAVGGNSVSVRALTVGERADFFADLKRATAGEIQKTDVPVLMLAKCIVPPLSDEDLRAMPGELFQAAVAKVLDLSGMGDEKKDEPPAPVI